MSRLLLLLLGLGFSQNIQHNPIKSSFSNEVLSFNIFVDANGREIDKVSLMYKNIEQIEYLNKEMIQMGNNNFQCVVMDHFSNRLDINYFFVVEFKDGGVLSHPIADTYVIDIIHYEDDYWEEIDSNEEAELLILSPLPNSKTDKEKVMIAVSMFSVNYIDVDSIKVILDNEDITSQTLIEDNFLSISNLNLSKGEHFISIHITNKFGVKYNPYSWSFIVEEDDDKKNWFSKKINHNFKYWSSYSESNISQNNTEYYDHNLRYDINLNWLKMKTNFKISSLENVYEQPKNRYSINLKNNNIELDLGDFHPYFNTYMLNGARVRGVNFHFRNNILSKNLSFSVNFISGELNRVVQGSPLDNSVYISEIDKLNENVLTINRDNYTFKRELSALKLGVGFYEKVFWSINLFKAKDNVNSVYAIIPNAEIEINVDDIDNLDSEYLNTHGSDSSTYLILYDDFILNYSDFINNIDSINYLENDWSGNKPKDNFIIGSELSFNLDGGKTIIHSEFNLSMLNENLWNSITDISQLDMFGSDTIQDGLFMDTPLDEVEKILEYDDFFQLGFDQVPYFPYEKDSENILKALFNMPSAIYEFDAKFNYGNHSIKYIYEKIGSEFNSLGNLYTQKNIIKTSISDRMRFFNNRLYLYLNYSKQKEGLDLTKDNIVETNIGSFNLSLYPGANLPNINFGFSNQDRFNNVSEVYTDEDCSDNCTLDSREHTYTKSYNISISDKILLLKQHDINFSMFISDKKDMLFDDKILSDEEYYSPRSYNKNISFSILTRLNQNWSSNIIYNNSNFNNGDNTESSDYYQEQNIASLDLSLKYSGIPLLDKLKLGFNSIDGYGSQDFIYYNFKLSVNHIFFNNLNIIWDYNYQMKWIDSDDMYNDSIFRMKLIFSL